LKVALNKLRRAGFYVTWRSWSKLPTTRLATRRISTTGSRISAPSFVSTLTRCSSQALTGTSCVTLATSTCSKTAASSTASTGCGYWTLRNV